MRFPRQGFRGVITPLLTPWTADGDLDRPALGRLIAHVLDGGAAALFAMGTTGEFANVSERLWSATVEGAVGEARGRVPVLAGITHCGTQASVSLAKAAHRLGADAVVSAPPFYYAASADIQQHYRTIADASPLPLFLYNMPRFTGVSLDMEFIQELAAHPNVIGLKDSSNDAIYLQTVLQRLGEYPDFLVLQGSEFLLALSLQAGVHGAVSGISNIYPRWLVGLVNAHFAGDRDTVLRIQRKLIDFLPYIRMRPAPLATLKTAAEILGLMDARLSPPLRGLCDDERARLAEFMKRNPDHL